MNTKNKIEKTLALETLSKEIIYKCWNIGIGLMNI